MIEICCIKCQASMQVDDAFAGSACRCQKCGTIQTVPKARRTAEPAGASKTLYTNLKRAGPPSSGLDALADVVSSGLSSGLRDLQGTPAKRNPRRLALMAGVAGGVVGIIITIIAGIALTRDAAPTPTGASRAEPGAAAAAAVRATFCGMAIDAPTVVYVLDRGNSTRDAMGHLVNATLASIRSLGRDRKFQVIFWDNGQAELAYPAGGPQFATRETVSAAVRVLDGVVAYGRTEITPAINKALTARPQLIVIVTAKGSELDQPFVDGVLNAHKATGGGTRINTVAIGESGDAYPKLAQATGGEHKQVTLGELRDSAD